MTEAPAIPVLTATRFDREYAPTCLSNGLVGITPGPNPLVQGKVLVSGYVYSHPQLGFENIAPAPYPLGLDIAFRGRRMREAAGRGRRCRASPWTWPPASSRHA